MVSEVYTFENDKIVLWLHTFEILFVAFLEGVFTGALFWPPSMKKMLIEPDWVLSSILL